MAETNFDAIGALNSKLNYSTTEKQVGIWIDGTTPIYEKCFVNLSANPAGEMIDSTINTTNATLIEASGASYNATYQQWLTIPMHYSTAARSWVMMNASGINISGEALSKYIIRVRYIKQVL